MKKVNGLTNRIAAMLLSGMLIVGSVPGTVLASDIQTDIGQTSEIATEEMVEMPSEDVPEETSAEEEMGAEEVSTEEEMGSEVASTEEEMGSEAASTEKNSENAAAQEEETITSYTVTLDANGGYFANEWDDAIGETVETTTILTKAIPVGGVVSCFPVREQENAIVTFLGWSLERDAEIVSQGYEEYTPVNNCVLYAVWQVDEDVAESEEESWGETDRSDAQDIEYVDESTDKEDTSQEFEDTGIVEDTEAETENADSVEGDETGLVAPEISEETAFEDAEVAKGEETIQEYDDTETAEIPEAAQEIEETEIIEEPEAGQKSEETEIAVISDSEQEVVDTDTAEEPVTFQESEDTEVEGETEERFVDDVAASDVYIVPETEGENATTDQQAIVPEQEEIYEDEEVGNTSEGSSGVAVAEEKTQPELNESSEEEEIVGEDAAMGVVESGTCGENLTWTLDEEGTLTISGTGDMEDYGHLKVGTYSGITPPGVAPWYYEYRNSIRRIVINEGVTSIGVGAFTHVGYDSFGNGYCKFDTISLPSTLTSIGAAAFAYSGCSKIDFSNHEITFESDWGLGAMAYSSFEEIVWGSSDLSSGMFKNSNLQEITLSSTISSIPYETFRGAKYLEEVMVPASVKSIGAYAFSGCKSLKSIEIPSSVESIDDYSFYECSALETVTMHEGVKSIGEGAFSDCTSLASIVLPEGLETIEWDLFTRCTSLRTISFPETLKEINYRTCDNCESLVSVEFAEGIEVLKSGSFKGCKNLTNITLPSTLTTLEGSVFENCDSLTNIHIPANVTAIGTEYEYKNNTYPSFAGSVNLESISVDEMNQTYSSYDGCLYNKSRTELLYCPEGKTRLTMSPNITMISQYALFCGAEEALSSKIKEIDFATYNPTIEENSFRDLTATAYYNNFLGNWPSDKRQNYGGTITWVEKPLNLSECTMTISPSSYTYDGTAKKPSVTLKYNGTNLTNNTDYTVSYSNNINAGTATVTATGKGYFTGKISKNFTINKTYTVSYDANGGTGTPSSQFKRENVSLVLSNIQPTKRYTISYNSCGGSVSPASKSVNCTFKNWNTAKNGSGTSYASGGNYSSNADATLYAQWTNPKAGELATPTRSGYAFVGWYTASSGGNQVTDSSAITGNVTLYAHWKDPYNLGDETYSFENYGDSDSKGGHCFGMSITSAGYENDFLNIRRIGGNANTPLYSFKDTPIVREPICYYQSKQGSCSTRATVAGGSVYKTGTSNIDSDWQEVVNYVKNHKYDNTGLLQIGFRKGLGGHAINFLRYEYVNGQDRIYAYDNNFPSQETYFYEDEYGRILQAPVQTFRGAIDCIALRDSRIYYSIVGSFDSTRALYMAKDDAYVPGYNYSLMDGAPSGENLVMYEIPADQERVTIIPNRDNADFIYMDTEFSFGEITDSTRGELIFSSMDEQSGGLDASFIIYEESESALIPTVTLSKTTFTYNGKVQKPSVTVKAGSTVLTESQDYIVEYPSGMVDVGPYKVKVTLIGNYSGVLYDTFEIVKEAQPLAASNLSLTFPNSGKITASGNKGSLSYKSSNTAIATVDSTGKVTAKGAGKATITITAAATSNYNTATKTITVTVAKAAQSVTASNLSLTYPNSGTISASGNKGSLSYKSSNTAIATVDSTGKVTAKGAGKATITITAAATSNYNAATKAITVTVAKAAQSITVKAGASSVAVGKTTTVSITGAKGTKSYKSSDTTIATVTSAGKVTAKKVGTVKITATSAATANYKAVSKTVTIKVVPAATTSLTAANQVTGIKLTWKKVTGANGYKIYRGKTLIKTITSGSTVTFVDKKANTNGTKYVYKLVAKASTGDSTLSKTRGIYRVTRPAIISLKNSASKKMTVKWGRNAKANGYQIQYSKSKTFASGNKTATAAGASTVSKVITSLTKGKTYYVRVRAYKTVNNVKFFSSWSVVKSVKISK